MSIDVFSVQQGVHLTIYKSIVMCEICPFLESIMCVLCDLLLVAFINASTLVCCHVTLLDFIFHEFY